jgi:hypothetical protein
MHSWIEKGGCGEDAAAEIRRLILTAPPESARAFCFTQLPDGDVSFKWVRVALAAHKP